MTILDNIRRKREEFQAKRETIAEAKLQRTLAKTERIEKRAKLQKQITEKKQYIANVNAAERERKFGFLKNLGAKATGKIKKGGVRLQSNNNSSGSVFNQNQGFNPLYHGSAFKTSGKGQSNVFTTTSSSNPFSFSSSAPKPMNKPKKVIIKQY
jgi:polyribonucleotide nucleotidyltransferase